MTRTFLLVPFFILLAVAGGCAQNPKDKNVMIETKYGNIVIRLYNDTPLHRDNFLKLVTDGYYNDILFHRVINEFMIQGGDPDSKNAPAGKMLGNGGPGYQVNAEIVYPKHFHKKGALAAARTADQINPQRQSSGSQFYIVQGKIYSDEELNMLEQSIAGRQTQEIMMKYMEPHREEFMALQSNSDNDGIRALMEQISQEATPEMEAVEAFKFPNEVREAYKTVGGTPHLDNAYTVFGEVIEGFDVIDTIAAVETDEKNRPLKDVAMKVKLVDAR
ncbi:MAG: peptidylprolyl isomerase [Cytophagaceae bacterium]|jgi:cyclophilin family peptidyl-prolyl cis-trans isomerase|nr:peptidylprolyl isomerase [Cytophagaceae bacterium]